MCWPFTVTTPRVLPPTGAGCNLLAGQSLLQRREWQRSSGEPSTSVETCETTWSALDDKNRSEAVPEPFIEVGVDAAIRVGMDSWERKEMKKRSKSLEDDCV